LQGKIVDCFNHFEKAVESYPLEHDSESQDSSAGKTNLVIDACYLRARYSHFLMGSGLFIRTKKMLEQSWDTISKLEQDGFLSKAGAESVLFKVGFEYAKLFYLENSNEFAFK
jgi:hypothetical protein